MLLPIVATGNHFFFEALAGRVVVAAAFLLARNVTAPRAAPELRWQAAGECAAAPC